jgi:hypothetical protein
MMVKSYRSRKINSFLALATLLGVLPFANAQNKETLDIYRAKYPGEQVIMLKDSKSVRIENVKGELRVVEQIHEEYLILDQNGGQFLAEESIGHSSFEVLKINEAYVMVPTEKGTKKVEVTNISTRDAESDPGIFHDDNKETNLLFPRLEPGALRVLDYTMVTKEIRFPFAFYFSTFCPIEESIFSVEEDTSIHTNLHTYFTEKIGVKLEETVNKNMRKKILSVKNPPAMKFEDGAPHISYFTPHVIGQIAYYTTKNGKVDVVGNLDDLYAWYYTNIQEVINEVPSEEIRMMADSLTRSISSEPEKVKAIYYWIQNNIKYIAFEEGVNGFIPRQPSAIIKKRYGDCKDMAALIYSMLKSVGIKSYMTWTGSRDLPYKYTEFPSSFCDNHMICTYKYDGKPYFLDATNNFLPMGEVASFTIGKEVFLSLDENAYEVLQMEVPPASATPMYDSTFIQIEGRKLKGEAYTMLDGYYQQWLQPAMSAYPNEPVKAIASFTEKGNNSYKVTKGSISNISDRDKPCVLTYEFTVDNYATSIDNETYINMVLEKSISAGELSKTRVTPYSFEHKSSDKYTVVLQIPDGYAVTSLPKNKSYNSDIVDFAINYRIEGNKVYMDLVLDIKTIMLQPTDFAVWNEYCSTSKSAMLQSLVLTKK